MLTNSGQTASTQVGMMRQRVRTVGFALLGGGRTDTTSPSVAAAAEVEANRRAAAGGWGVPGDNEALDPELEALMASDRPAGATRKFFPRSTAGGYHRVGATATPAEEAVEEEEEEGELPHLGPQTGYYELALRSVEAVRYDPEVDE